MHRTHSAFLYASIMSSVQLVYTSCTLRIVKDKHEYMLMILQTYFYIASFRIKTESIETRPDQFAHNLIGFIVFISLKSGYYQKSGLPDTSTPFRIGIIVALWRKGSIFS